MKELSEGRNDVMITDSESQGGKSPHSSSDSIIINMPFSQWSKLVEQKGATPRKRLNAGVTRFLTNKLHDQFKISCQLTCDNNWFAKRSIKSVSHWYGKFRCTNKSCQAEFIARVKDVPIDHCDVEFQVTYEKVEYMYYPKQVFMILKTKSV